MDHVFETIKHGDAAHQEWLRETCRDLEVVLVRMQARTDQRCAICGMPATCFGSYEDPENPIDFACDSCCGHGNEDGWCEQISGVADEREGAEVQE